jgi:hypothetical protein
MLRMQSAQCRQGRVAKSFLLLILLFRVHLLPLGSLLVAVREHLFRVGIAPDGVVLEGGPVALNTFFSALQPTEELTQAVLSFGCIFLSYPLDLGDWPVLRIHHRLRQRHLQP